MITMTWGWPPGFGVGGGVDAGVGAGVGGGVAAGVGPGVCVGVGAGVGGGVWFGVGPGVGGGVDRGVGAGVALGVPPGPAPALMIRLGQERDEARVLARVAEEFEVSAIENVPLPETIDLASNEIHFPLLVEPTLDTPAS